VASATLSEIILVIVINIIMILGVNIDKCYKSEINSSGWGMPSQFGWTSPIASTQHRAVNHRHCSRLSHRRPLTGLWLISNRTAYSRPGLLLKQEV